MIDNTHPAHAEEYEVGIVPNVEAGVDEHGMPTIVPGRETPPEPPKPRTDPDADRKAKEQESLVAALRAERDAKLAEAERERQARADLHRQATERIREEQAARIEAEQEANKYTNIASRAHWTTLHTRKEQFESGAANARSIISAIKRDIKLASESSDHERFAELQEQLAEAVTHRQTYEQATAQIDAEIEDTKRRFQAMQQRRPAERPEARETPPERKPAPEPQVQTPEQWIESTRHLVGSDAVTWLNEHKDYVTDRTKHEHLLTFSKLYALKHGQDGLKSSDFTKALNAEFFPSSEEATVEEKPAEEPVAVAKKPNAAPAAPVTRNASPSKPSQSGNRIELTAEQHAIAPELYPAGDYESFSDNTKSKFKSWSPTAARWQYHEDLQKSIAAGKMSR